ncbi:hypothetical protein [Corynebacterium timonense]|uniref:Uncharacterized protein n=1 Tax=Corynebacterium timonense TaxID=441500 RepID=A0A1H1M4J5_9CORY|nr:hypothetical protein [Corynebacterium timonense]SDR81600.1 hypothetical protein SAMN04488539_0431 [Corynebacterium timonense]
MMRWQGTTLVDAPTPASVTDGVLEFGRHRLRFVSEDPTDVRAVDPEGRAFRLRATGLTVARYEAQCDTRTYTARRTSGKRREIARADGTIAATTHGRPDGSLDVTPRGELTLDLVFISWALTYVDTPTRRMRY